MAKKLGTKVPATRWLLMIHQLPTKPAYHRVKIWRQIQDTGAISIKNAVYVLPPSDTARAAFASILEEIESKGGDGLICEAALLDGINDNQLRALFNSARDVDYHAIATELRQLSQAWKKAKRPKSDPVQALTRIAQRLSDLRRLDFFGAEGRRPAEALLSQMEHSAIVRAEQAQPPCPVAPTDMRGKVWVTRRDIHVDRIASAWLIKRFIDPQGTLKFVASPQYEPRPGEYRYDMKDGEFTHEGDNCSFETLLARSGISDAALRAVAEVVHDIDISDGKFGHPETPGIAHVISGICRTQGDDEARVARGSELLDGIYEQFRRRKK
jgi:hypothetical protein